MNRILAASSPLAVAATAVPSPPIPRFSYAVDGFTVIFDATLSTDPDGFITGYAWNFGDGGTASGVATSHLFIGAGTWTVALTVTGSDGVTATATKSLTLVYEQPAPDNLTPEAQFTFTATFLDVAFDGGGSSDPDGSIASYAWNFGDGATATGATPNHTFAAGSWIVSLTVTDNLGATDTYSHSVTVSGVPNTVPEASFTYVTVDRQVTFTDTSSDPDGTVTAWFWDFGDGNTSALQNPVHTFATHDTFTVELTVTDNSSGSATSEQDVELFNEPPLAEFSFTDNNDLSVDFDATSSSDPDGTIVTYAWDFGDGTFGSGAIVSHIYASEADYDVILTVTDNG